MHFFRNSNLAYFCSARLVYFDRGGDWAEKMEAVGKASMANEGVEDWNENDLAQAAEEDAAKAVDDAGKVSEEDEISELSWQEQESLETIESWEFGVFKEDREFMEKCFKYWHQDSNNCPEPIRKAISTKYEAFKDRYFGPDGITENTSEADRNYKVIQLADMNRELIYLKLKSAYKEVEGIIDEADVAIADDLFKLCEETANLVSSLPKGMRGEYSIVSNIIFGLHFLDENFPKEYKLQGEKVQTVLDQLKNRGHGTVNNVPLGAQGYDSFPIQPEIPEGAERLQQFEFTNFQNDLSTLMEVYDAIDKKPVNRDQLSLLFQTFSELESRYASEIEAMLPKKRIDFYQTLSYVSSLTIAETRNFEYKIDLTQQDSIRDIENTLDQLEKAVGVIEASKLTVSENDILYWHRAFNTVFFSITKIAPDPENDYANRKSRKAAEPLVKRLDEISARLEPYKQKDGGVVVTMGG